MEIKKGISPEIKKVDTTNDTATAAVAPETVIKELCEMRESMVSKEEYEKAIADKEKYRKALMYGIKSDVAPKTAHELRAEYLGHIKRGTTLLNGFSTALKLREAVINETGVDPFMSEALYKLDPGFGERVSGQLQELVDSSDNNASVFAGRFNAILR